MDDPAEPVQRQLPIVLAAVGAIVAAALWALVLVLPYAKGGGTSFRLLDGDDPVRTAVVAPRVVGIVLVAAAAAATLALRRRNGPWWTTSGALLGLLAFSTYWWTGSSDLASYAQHGVAWYLDGAACLLALVVLAGGAAGALDRSGRLRPPSAPYMVVVAAVGAGLALLLMSRSHWFIPALHAGGELWGSTPAATRVAAWLTALAVVALLVVAPLARSRAATTGLALGWLALLAPLVAHVIALRDAVPGHVGSTFIAGCLVAGLTVVALLTWASVARPAEPPPRTAAERRAREDTEPLEL